jgi:LmbE family N-acetylglucosaminyl deacetylase
MHIEDLGQARRGYGHIYLSPHLDDAALSCGGAIASLVATGEPVLVVTFSTAAPPPEGPFSTLAEQFHADWQLTPEQAVAARLLEERMSMERLGCDYHWAGLLDAIYRYPAAYDRREALFGLPAAGDPLADTLPSFVGALRERFPDAAFYAPLGVGSHVDHLITHAAARDTLGEAALFYEDLPYAIKPGALDRRLAELGGAVESRTIAIDAALQQKIGAIDAYASQLGELFGGADAMVEAITAYARSVRPAGGEYGERLWAYPVQL